MRERRSLGTTGAAGLKVWIGVAYITIPEDRDREAFIKSCFRKKTVMLRDESGGLWRNVFISNEAMANVVFPATSTERGTTVVYGRVPKHNFPVVIASLGTKDSADVFFEEEQFRLQKRKGGNSVDFIGRAQEASVDLSISSSDNGKGILRVNIINPDQTAKLDIYVKGEIKTFADKKISLGTNEEIEIRVSKPNEEQLSVIRYKAGEGFTIVDEFNNTILLQSGFIKIKEGSQNGKTIHLKDGKINLGSDDAAEKGVLGDKLKSLLNDLMDQIGQITVPTALGPSGIPINKPAIDAIAAQLDTVLSQVVKLD